MMSKFAHNNFLGNGHKIKTTHKFLRLVGGVRLFCFKIYNDYLTKAIFSIPQNIKKKLIIDIHNKGAKDAFGVSAIKMEPNDLVDTNLIKNSIESVLSSNLARMGTVECPRYISEVVQTFTEQIKEHGINLDIVSTKDFQIVCKVSSENGDAMLRLWYGTSIENHTKGFVNKIDIFDITNPNIAKEIRNLIELNGQCKLTGGNE